jgi:hypothetical protein
MKWSELVDAKPVLDAIAEFDRLGREPFLAKYGYGPSTHLFIRANGKLYDIKVIAGVAYGHAFPEKGALKNNEFASGKTLMALFRRLGFEVVDQSAPSALAAAREFRAGIESLFTGYLAGKSSPISKSSPAWAAADRAVTALQTLVAEYPHIKVGHSVGKGNWADVPWIALLDDRLTQTTRRGVYAVYLFRADMTGLYGTFNQGVSDLKDEHGWPTAKQLVGQTAGLLRTRFGERLRSAYTVADGIDLRSGRAGLGAQYEASTIAWKLYEPGALPDEQTLLDDLYLLLDVYDEYAADPAAAATAPQATPAATTPTVASLVTALRGRGFTFESWQIAAFVTALRTKPYVILAGISGTGKSRLPLLVGELTGAHVELIPVRPDWTDSADLIGYANLAEKYVPGRLLELASRAAADPTRPYVALLDEMNLARVEQYFAEVLSLIEDRVVVTEGGYASRTPLAPSASPPWGGVHLPANLAIVGTVNMDETTHGFSRKVLDRAFTLEMSEVDLTQWRPVPGTPALAPWPASAWRAKALRPGELVDTSEAETEAIARAIDTLQQVNRLLSPAQLQVGYRVRDEIAMFLLHAADEATAFVTSDGSKVDPLDLALNMKVLPRIQGGSGAIRTVLRNLIGWAQNGKLVLAEEDARVAVEQWTEGGRLGAVPGARFPRTLARLCLMWERLQTDGFTSYWL